MPISHRRVGANQTESASKALRSLRQIIIALLPFIPNSYQRHCMWIFYCFCSLSGVFFWMCNAIKEFPSLARLGLILVFNCGKSVSMVWLNNFVIICYCFFVACNAGEASAYVCCVLSEQAQVGTHCLRVHRNLLWGEYLFAIGYKAITF